MKKIIFRFPTTKRSKVIGGMFMDIALETVKTAEKFGRNEDGTYTDFGWEMIEQATDLANKAARRFGFLSYSDMNEYKNRHGKI